MAVTSNPIGFLQEICVKYRLGDLPKYIDVDSFGPDHCKTFKVKCIFNNRSVVAKASSKKAAKTEAASQMVTMLQDEGYFQSYQLEVDVNSLTVVNGRVDAQQPTPVDELNKNPISFLQEYCQKNNMLLPLYLSSDKCPFTCTCEVNGEKSQAQGGTKKQAKLKAAYAMCIKLGLVTETKNNDNDNDNESDRLLSPLTQQNEKTAVSSLKELCDRNPLSPQPIYADKMSGNTFIVECTMGTRVERGEGSSKKEAKAEAARKMLIALQNPDVRSYAVDQLNGSRNIASPVDPSERLYNGAAAVDQLDGSRNGVSPVDPSDRLPNSDSPFDQSDWRSMIFPKRKYVLEQFKGLCDEEERQADNNLHLTLKCLDINEGKSDLSQPAIKEEPLSNEACSTEEFTISTDQVKVEAVNSTEGLLVTKPGKNLHNLSDVRWSPGAVVFPVPARRYDDNATNTKTQYDCKLYESTHDTVTQHCERQVYCSGKNCFGDLETPCSLVGCHRSTSQFNGSENCSCGLWCPGRNRRFYGHSTLTCGRISKLSDDQQYRCCLSCYSDTNNVLYGNPQLSRVWGAHSERSIQFCDQPYNCGFLGSERQSRVCDNPQCSCGWAGCPGRNYQFCGYSSFFNDLTGSKDNQYYIDQPPSFDRVCCPQRDRQLSSHYQSADGPLNYPRRASQNPCNRQSKRGMIGS